MEIKIKYQYSYFIYPYTIEEENYEKYICGLINNKRCKIKIFEKEKDLDIYDYFTPKIREKYFQTFELTREERKDEKKLIEKIKKHNCIVFEYRLGNNTQGKIGEKNGIFFKIPKIEIICFNTGICFINIKTHIEESEDFKDVLNFNYKFRDINSEFAKLKQYENIKIQTDIFNDILDINKIIKNIIGQETGNRRFFTHTYTCVDSESWNSEINKIESEFLKYAYVYPSNYDVNFEKDSLLERISKWKYIKIAGTKQCSSILTTNLETLNYTKLPFQYENEYLYTVILNLYKNEYLELLKNNMNDIKKINKFEEIYKDFMQLDLTQDETGETMDNMWKKVFGIDRKIKKIQNKIDTIDKNIIIKRYRGMGKIITIILIASIILNIVNLLLLFRTK